MAGARSSTFASIRRFFSRYSASAMIRVWSLLLRSMAGSCDRSACPPAVGVRSTALYHRPGACTPLYQDGRPVGKRPSSKGCGRGPKRRSTTLPNCQNLIPLAAVSIDSKVKAGITVEYPGDQCGASAGARDTPIAPSSRVPCRATSAVEVAGPRAHSRTRLDSLDFHALAVNTGAHVRPDAGSLLRGSERRGGGRAW